MLNDSHATISHSCEVPIGPAVAHAAQCAFTVTTPAVLLSFLTLQSLLIVTGPVAVVGALGTPK